MVLKSRLLAIKGHAIISFGDDMNIEHQKKIHFSVCVNSIKNTKSV